MDTIRLLASVIACEGTRHGVITRTMALGCRVGGSGTPARDGSGGMGITGRLAVDCGVGADRERLGNTPGVVRAGSGSDKMGVTLRLAAPSR